MLIDKTQAGIAPDFTLTDTEGKSVRLSDYKGKKNVCWFSTAASYDPTAAGIWRSCARNTLNLSSVRPRLSPSAGGQCLFYRFLAQP